MLRLARAALYTVVPAELLLMTLLIAGVPLPAPVLVAGEAVVALVLALEAVTAYRLFGASRRAGMGRRAALSATYGLLVPAPVRKLLEFELKGMVSLGLWVVRRRHGVPPGATALSYSKEQSTTILLVLFMMVVELVAVDLLLVAFDVPTPIRVAVLVIDLYGVLFGLAFGAACVTRPHVLTDDELRIRCGAYFDLRIPRELITSMRVSRAYNETGMVTVAAGRLSVAVSSQTNVVVELAEPITVTRPLGATESVTSVRFFADTPTAALRPATA
ncbi:hypothetical protein GCM10010404_68870 [Nonomuraea africana]|uniref:Integral membrane protein n=1 Tax=Nonomuraea africana TaxID=46171 RepID=A0ABR9K811_9ACTN|nr:hypothetical protein [Nonomuraea africana]MBE1557712.1 hypothetical protein [Nonomuraea africana]